MIPWDYDLDVSVRLDQLKPLFDVLVEIKDSPVYDLDSSCWLRNGFFKIALKTDHRIILDVFLVGNDGTGVYRCLTTLSRKRWPQWFYDNAAEFTERELVPFEDREFYIPKTDRILRRHYGDEYMVKRVYHEAIEAEEGHEDWLKRKCIPVDEHGELIHEETKITY